MKILLFSPCKMFFYNLVVNIEFHGQSNLFANKNISETTIHMKINSLNINVTAFLSNVLFGVIGIIQTKKLHNPRRLRILWQENKSDM